ncbi:MAG: transposase [Treponema sp.]|jgi:REP element-mobilizing transposase RayT|nr:transposase [Treponema sp.]
MRKLRLLLPDVWYKIKTRVNNREPLFRRSDALALFLRVFRQAEKRYDFEVRLLRLEDDWLTFYIKPADGYELPAIMKWVKQVFAQRFNGMDGRIGHIWGDRYGSEVIEGEPPGVSWEGGRPGSLEPPGREVGGKIGVRPRYGESTKNPRFSLNFPLSGVPPSG